MAVSRSLGHIRPLILAFGLAACGSSNFNAFGPLKHPKTYNELFPYSVQLCAVSGIDKLAPALPSIHGGMGGHSVLFLHGACRDRDQHYPVLRLCRRDDPADPEGVGISANAHFQNANWIATDGPGFFFSGGLKPGQKLDWRRYQSTQAEARKMGLLDGVVYHPEIMHEIPSGLTPEQYQYELSVSTDYAISFGRGRICAHLPVTQRQMSQIVTQLNNVNAPYRSGAQKYRWNVLQNNCTHLCHNALAAANEWDANRINRFVLKAAFDFPVPKNDLMNLVERQDDIDLTDLAALWRDPVAHRAVMDDHILPARPGMLLTSTPIWQNNDVYKTQQLLIFYQDPIFGTYRDRYQDAINDPKLTTLTSNFRYYDDRYTKLLSARHSLAWWLTSGKIAKSDQNSFKIFYDAYYDVATNEENNLKKNISALNAKDETQSHPSP